MFRPYRNRQNWRLNFTPEQIEIALKANQLLSAGKPNEAAPLFASLAKDMEDSHHPRRAANLHAQAAHAFTDSQNEPSALIQARKALSLFIQYQMVERTPRFYANITRKNVTSRDAKCRRNPAKRIWRVGWSPPHRNSTSPVRTSRNPPTCMHTMRRTPPQ